MHESQAVKPENKYVHSHNGNWHYQKITKGWKLCIKWKDGTTSWEQLADFKESYPIKVAEFAVSRDIHDKATLSWWVPYVLMKRNQIISIVNRHYQKHTHKYGIEIPNLFDDCVSLDQENGNTLWQDAIQQEMSKVCIAFQTLDDDEAIPPTYQEIQCHMVWDVKMGDFCRKARFVAGGHMTETPASNTYASVVSHESVRIALTLAALKDLEVKTANTENAYLTAPVMEKIWCVLGTEFGANTGKHAIIVRSLHHRSALFR